MAEKRYRILFEGEMLPGREPAEVRRRLGEALGLDPEEADRLFAGQRVVVVEDVEKNAALSLKNAFLSAGALCLVEAVETSEDEGETEVTLVDMVGDLPASPAEWEPEGAPAQPPPSPPPAASSAGEPEPPEPGPEPRRHFRHGPETRKELDQEEAAYQEEKKRFLQSVVTGGAVTGVISALVFGWWAVPQAGLLFGIGRWTTLACMGLFLGTAASAWRFGWKGLAIASVATGTITLTITGGAVSIKVLMGLMIGFPLVVLVAGALGAIPGAAVGYIIWSYQNPEDGDTGPLS